MHWIKVQNIYTFAYQKTLPHTLFCKFLESAKASSVSLKKRFTFFAILSKIFLIQQVDGLDKFWESICLWNLAIVSNVLKNYFNTFSGATRNDFCFSLNGTRGNVDSNIRDIPGNTECDLRVTYEQNGKQGKCRDESPTLSLISVSDLNIFWTYVNIARYLCSFRKMVFLEYPALLFALSLCNSEELFKKQ